MLWTVFVVLLGFWVFGLISQGAGGMIQLLLVAAAPVTLISVLLSGWGEHVQKKVTDT
jgi:hypothetical protein